ncbi:MAG: hypothetical protein AAFN92_13630 [Bacteroidota bacterium]
MSATLTRNVHPQEALLLPSVEASPFTQRADVILGMLRHDCRFHGICKIVDTDTETSGRGCDGPRVRASLLRSHPNFASLLIPRGQLSPGAEAYHFGRPTLRCHRPTRLPPRPGVTGRPTRYLRPGAYPIVHTDKHYLIHFPLGNY